MVAIVTACTALRCRRVRPARADVKRACKIKNKFGTHVEMDTSSNKRMYGTLRKTLPVLYEHSLT
jgi:hypothetical protein